MVYAGTRFCAQFELLTEHADDPLLTALIDTLRSPLLRLGSGSRSGLGEMSVIDCQTAILDLRKEDDRAAYLSFPSAFDQPWEHWQTHRLAEQERLAVPTAFTRYTLTLRPDDFFLLGSGMGDDEADLTPVTETRVLWDALGHATLSQHHVLLPGSSLKGAIAHRTAYHYNRLNQQFADEALQERLRSEGYSTSENVAVRALFGYEQDGHTQAGRVLIGDVMGAPIHPSLESETTKLLNHVSIDRFTGGAIDGALFSEKTIYTPEATYEVSLLVRTDALADASTQEAFEQALRAITTGRLALGGGTNRGHGIFTGTLTRNDSIL